MAQADVADAVPLLERFINSQPPANASWIGDYKPLAQKYLDDCRLYAAWKNESKPGDPKASLQRLQELKERLKMPSAIREAVSAEEKSLNRQVGDQQKTESVAHEQTKKKQVEQAVQKKPQWLAQWKTKLIDDLTHRHFSGAIVDIGGTQYTGIEAATPDKLAMKIPYGTMQIDWSKLSPKTLLAISVAFIQPNAPDAADRQWLCAVYASETGQTDIARQLADAAAKSKSEYRDEIDALFVK